MDVHDIVEITCDNVLDEAIMRAENRLAKLNTRLLSNIYNQFLGCALVEPVNFLSGTVIIEATDIFIRDDPAFTCDIQEKIIVKESDSFTKKLNQKYTRYRLTLKPIYREDNILRISVSWSKK